MAILKKGLLGAEDFYSGTDTTFTRVNSTGGTSTLTKALSTLLQSPVTAPNPLAFDVNLQFKGPNPWLDVTRFGARAPTPFSGTATMSAASTIATLASAGNFLNGDGVVIYGAGATNAMATPAAPTVTPSLAAGATGTGKTVDSVAAATTYNYQIVLRDKNGGLTAASAVGSTTIGMATLGAGASPVTITSYARANNVVTVVTASAHDLVVGAIVYITAGTDATFSGYYVVDTTTDNTHFTYKQGMDTRGGASASATGGAARWYVANKLTLPALGANGWQYYIYGRTGGSLTLIGVSRPLETTWEDYGSPFMDGISLPTYVPTSAPPSVATNDWLSTTIVSGGGTTTLTLANASTNAVTAAVIKYDDAPGISAAAIVAATSETGVMYLPANKTFTVNSYLTLPANSLGIWQAGVLTLNETIQLGQGVLWHGDNGGSGGNTPQFASIRGRRVTVATAYPGIYFSNLTSSHLRGLSFDQPTNQGLIMLTDGGSSSSFELVNFSFGTGNADYMGMALVMRGGFNYTFKVCSFLNSGPTTNGISTTPTLFRRRDTAGNNPPGKLVIRDAHFSGRGIHQDDGIHVFLEHIYSQVMRAPLFSITSGAGSLGGRIEFYDTVTDTSNQPVLANWTDTATGAGMSALVTLRNVGVASNEAGGVPGNLTGKPIFRGVLAIDSLFIGQNFQGVIEIGQDSSGVYRVATPIQKTRRLLGSGQALVAGDFALHANWGSGAAVSAVTGTDLGWQITVTAAGTPGSNPTITLTFKDGTWTLAPICSTKQVGGTGVLTNAVTEVPTATTNVITWNGTPVAASTYIFASIVMGR